MLDILKAYIYDNFYFSSNFFFFSGNLLNYKCQIAIFAGGIIGPRGYN